MNETDNELEMRGAWQLLMSARAHVLHNQDLDADAVLAGAVYKIQRSDLRETGTIIESRFWVNTNMHPYLGVDLVNLRTGESKVYGRY